MTQPQRRRRAPAPAPALEVPPPSAVAIAAAPPAPGFRLTTGLMAVLITVILQAVATISWAAKMDSRVAAIETAIGPITDGTVARLDERTRNIEKGVERIERLAMDRNGV